MLKPVSSARSYQAMEEAADWYALLSSQSYSAQDLQQWQQWLLHEPNQQAWNCVEKVCQLFDGVPKGHSPKHTVDRLLTANQPVLRRRQLLGLMILGSAALGMSFISWRYTRLPVLLASINADYKTQVGQIQQLTLPDGSQLWLNTASVVKQHFTRDQRLFELIEGEVFIQTAHDARPFYVQAGDYRVQALGTRFSVRKLKQPVQVNVFEHAVEVTGEDITAQRIEKGQQLDIADGQALQRTADIARESWTRGILVAEDISLGQLVNELRLYRSGYLGLSPTLTDLRVYGSFPLDDTDKALHLLTEILPIRIQQRYSWWTTIEKI